MFYGLMFYGQIPTVKCPTVKCHTVKCHTVNVLRSSSRILYGKICIKHVQISLGQMVQLSNGQLSEFQYISGTTFILFLLIGPDYAAALSLLRRNTKQSHKPWPFLALCNQPQRP